MKLIPIMNDHARRKSVAMRTENEFSWSGLICNVLALHVVATCRHGQVPLFCSHITDCIHAMSWLPVRMSSTDANLLLS